MFVSDWSFVLKNLRIYYDDKIIEKVRLSHASNTNLFSLRNLIKLRMLGYYSRKEYQEYKFDLQKQSNIPKMIIFLVSILPRNMLLIFNK